MPEKRKDSKGRVLKDGESQRANGTYDYRYTDIHKKRRCIYAKSLTELRKKEEELWRDLADGIDYAAGEMTVADLVDRYMNLKRGLKPNSLRSYNTAVKRIHADPFGQKAIKHVLRHTFCTNVQQAGLDVKSLQYLMGHSNASVTLDVYTYSSFESVERAFEQIAGNL